MPRGFTVTACYVNGDGTYTVRILNNSESDKTLPVTLFGIETSLGLRAFAHKTLTVSDTEIKENE